MTEARPDPEREAALAAFAAGDFARAARILPAVLARTAPTPDLLRACGMAFARIGDAARGATYTEAARRLAPADPVTLLWHGIVLQAASRTEEAAEALAAAAAASPSDPAPLVHLARSLLASGRAEQAAAAASEALRRAPGLAEASHALRIAELDLARRRGEAGRALAARWRALADSCLRLDNIADARAAFAEAHAAAPAAASSVALARLAHLCGEPLSAMARLRTLLAEGSADPEATLLLARFLVMDGSPAEALALLDAAGDDVRRLPAWAFARGRALERLGRMAEAASAFARAARDGAGKASGLAHQLQRTVAARRAGRPEARALLAAVDAATRHRADPIEDRIEAHFTIAACHESDGNHQAAFGHLRAGHALLRRAQPFSRSAAETLFGAVRDAASDLPDHAGAPDTRPMPVFIVGLPRTGTSLLQQILASHPAVHGAGERTAIREALAQATGTDDAIEAMRRVAAIAAPDLAASRAAFRVSLRALAPDAACIVDKMPDNLRFLPFIARLLPEARIICCTRDLRDVGTSIFRQRFLGHHPYAHDPADLGWYIARHEHLRAQLAETIRLPVLTVDHADWLGDFDATLRRVLGFLDLPWDEACVRFFEHETGIRTASRTQVRRPINADGVGMWKYYEKELAPLWRELPV